MTDLCEMTLITRTSPRPTHLAVTLPRTRTRQNPNSIFQPMSDQENMPPPSGPVRRSFAPLPGFPTTDSIIRPLNSPVNGRCCCMFINRRLQVCTHEAAYVVGGYPVCTRHRTTAQSRQSNDRRWFANRAEVDASDGVVAQPRGADGTYLPADPAAATRPVSPVRGGVLVDLTSDTPETLPPLDNPLFGVSHPRAVSDILSWWDQQHIPNVILTFASALLHAQRMPDGPFTLDGPPQDCSICMGAIDPGERRFTTRCAPVPHHFHACCVAEMCMTQAVDRDYPVDPLHVICPLCRGSIDDSVSDYRYALFSGKCWPKGMPAHWLYYLTHSLSPGDDFVAQVHLVAGDARTLSELNVADIRRAARSYCDDLADFRLGWEDVRSRLVREARDDSSSSEDDDEDTHPVIARRRLALPLPAPPPAPTPPPASPVPTTAAPVSADTPPGMRTPPATLPGVRPFGGAPSAPVAAVTATPSSAAPRPPAPTPAVAGGWPFMQLPRASPPGTLAPALATRGLTVSYQGHDGTVSVPRTPDSRLAIVTFPLDHLLVGLQHHPVFFMAHQATIPGMTPANLIATRDPQRVISTISTTTTVPTNTLMPDWLRGVTVTLCMPVVSPDQV